VMMADLPVRSKSCMRWRPSLASMNLGAGGRVILVGYCLESFQGRPDRR